MTDGWFVISLEAYGLSETGTMRISGLHAVGRCASCRVRGEINAADTKLEAIITVRMTPPHLPSRLIPDSFSLSMIGVGTEDQFTLHGVGPLGLIVELTGRSTSASHQVAAAMH